uniref:Mu transposase C-terminal domain-containing protein n=1 Tax=Cetobacterium sp. TaxID=2071632 RepID=UPI003AEF6C61
KINFIQEESDENILRFVKYIDTDILKEFNINKPKDIKDISEFIKKYLFIEESETTQLKDEDRVRLLYFLNRYKRKVYNSGVRVKNNMYNSPLLKEREGEVVDIFYNEFSKESVEVYLKEKFIDRAKIIK